MACVSTTGVSGLASMGSGGAGIGGGDGGAGIGKGEVGIGGVGSVRRRIAEIDESMVLVDCDASSLANLCRTASATTTTTTTNDNEQPRQQPPTIDVTTTTITNDQRQQQPTIDVTTTTTTNDRQQPRPLTTTTTTTTTDETSKRHNDALYCVSARTGLANQIPKSPVCGEVIAWPTGAGNGSRAQLLPAHECQAP